MRRPHRYPRVLIALCGLIDLGGCNQYGVRPEGAASAAVSTDRAPQQVQVRAELDIPAILDDLVGPTSPYCAVARTQQPALPLIATLGAPVPQSELGMPGVCVVQASQAEAAAVLHGPTENGKEAKYLP
jgi:hypothetical protein